MPDRPHDDGSPLTTVRELSVELASAVETHRSGRIEAAEEAYRRVLVEWPDCAEAHHMLGVARMQQEKHAEAVEIFRRAIDLDDSQARYHSNLGSAYLRLGQWEKAIAALERALAYDPGFLDARYNLGVAYLELARLGDAEAEFRAVLRAQPQHLAACNNLGAVLIRQKRTDEALSCFRNCLDLEPQNPAFLVNLAFALERINELDEAERAGRQALEIDASATAPAYLLARLDHRRDRLPEAKERLQALLIREQPMPARIDILFELGLVLDRMGEATDAFRCFVEANALLARNKGGKVGLGDWLLERARANRAWFTRPRLDALVAAHPVSIEHEGAGKESAGLVFFVGFPRSGTTLVEQALEAHPKLVTTGEVSPLEPIVARLMTGSPKPHKLAELARGDVCAARTAFWKTAEARHGPLAGRYLVDKLPLSIVDLGVVNLLFPSARVIVALRDPRDVCLSCFMQRFKLNASMVNFLDLARTAETYAAVMGLWLQYREMLSLPWIEYRYEEVVEDFEAVMVRLLDFIGVGWQADVARYRELSTGKAVTTPSYRDVGSALYSRAVGRWRAYREPLDPVLDQLRPFAEAFGYPED